MELLPRCDIVRFIGLSGMIIVLAVALAARAYGQSSRVCEARLAKAEAQYHNGHFERAVQLALSCAAAAHSRSQAEKAYRLLVLAYLRQGNEEAARLAGVQLLSASPAYQPDSVQDPPAYMALINEVRQQQPDTVSASASRSSQGRSPIASYRARRTIFMGGSFGLTHYGGERSRLAENWLGELTSAASPGGELKVGYNVTPRYGLLLFYGADSYPELLAERGSPPDFEPIDEATSSRWVHTLGLMGEIQWLSDAPVALYLQGGVTGAFRYANGVFRAGLGPRIGAGLDVALMDQGGLFVEGTGSAIAPGNALDLADPAFPYDILAVLSVGMRIRVARLF